MSIASIDDGPAFWEIFLGQSARWRTTLERPCLGKIVGIPDGSNKAAFVDPPGGIIHELLDYQTPDKWADPEATQNPGNVHPCLAVEDAGAASKRALDCAAYLRIHGGTLEFI